MSPRALITPAELDEWRRVYPTGGAAAVQALFPHRTKNCINVTAHRHGIKVAELPAFRVANCAAMSRRSNSHYRSRWTRESEDILREFYPAHGDGFIMWMLPMRTSGAIRHKAWELDLKAPKAPSRIAETPRRARLATLFLQPQVSA
jgi:hypothetical protein